MIPNKDVFCQSPWYELQIYWNGDLGFCCQENEKMYPESTGNPYNIRNMTIAEWYNSEPMQKARMMMFDNQRNSVCVRCYRQQEHSGTSRRHKGNQKSVIFTKANFSESFEQSPAYNKFMATSESNGAYSGLPIDLHIDLGNYCNLACKMCNPRSSSAVAVQHVKWGIDQAKQFVGNDWTRDPIVWHRVIDELAAIPDLRNIHFMGGETLITPRFRDFVDHMTQKQRFDLNFSFVTNGTTFDSELMDKLMKFGRVGIEVSIETVTPHNAYQRQGTDTAIVLSNIERYLRYCDNQRVTLTVRPALSLLTIGNYYTLLEYCLEKQLVVKSLLVSRPRYLDIALLPESVKQQYRQRYLDMIHRQQLNDDSTISDFNESDPTHCRQIVLNEARQVLSLLDQPTPGDSKQQFDELVNWCQRWDNIYNYNALELYPELADTLTTHGYKKI